MSTDKKYVRASVARERLGVSNRTLKNWSESGDIEFIKTKGGWRHYNLDRYLKENDMLEKKKICYARVSSHDRKDDLSRQVEFLKNKYPEHEIITDIGSGINFKRKGLRTLIKLAMSNTLSEVVVTYKDRLCRIGYDLIEFIFSEYSKAKIIIENDQPKPRHEEITEDLIEIITVYSSKIYGARSHKKINQLDKKQV